MMLKKVDSDAAEMLQRLWTETFCAAYCDVHSTENIRRYCEVNYSLDAARRTLADPETDCVFAFVEKEPAGFYVVKHHDCPVGDLDQGASELKQIYVLADHYGAGVGSALFNDALAKIRARGRQWVWLVVSDKNRRARAFYSKLSFSVLGAGPLLVVGTDEMTSSVLARPA